MLSALVRTRQAQGWPGPVLACHADLGRAEWPQTPGHVEQICRRYGIELEVVRRPKGDLLTRFEERIESLAGTDTCFWPAPGPTRYCTSDMKTTPLNTIVTRYERVISAVGIRAEESRERAQKSCWVPHKRDGKRMAGVKGRPVREALTWNAVFDWLIGDVWQELGTSRVDLIRRQELYREGKVGEAFDGWIAHPAYVLGNDRLSCVLCIMGSRSDLLNGARHNPALYQHYVELEQRTGFKFQQGKALGDLISQQELL